MTVVPLTLGGQLFCVPPGSIEPVAEPEEEAKLASRRLAGALGLEPREPFQYFRLKGAGLRAGAVAVDHIGPAEFRLFRRLDPVWKNAGPEWLRRWMELCPPDSHPMACRMSQTRSLAVLADAQFLGAILDRI
jgi:hypothetical protein